MIIHENYVTNNAWQTHTLTIGSVHYHNIYFNQKTDATEASENLLSLLHTLRPLQSLSFVVWVDEGVSDDWVLCVLLDGWQLGSEVHCSLCSVTLSGLAFRDSKKGFDEDDSEALWHLAAAAAAALHILRASGAALWQPEEGNKVHTVI